MGFRAYLLITVNDDTQPTKFSKILQKIDKLKETDYVDPVNGAIDIIVMIEVPVTIKPVMKKIQRIDGVAKVQSCKILGVHKEW